VLIAPQNKQYDTKKNRRPNSQAQQSHFYSSPT
jgi:hypothetical protein